jgi:hypothetical protein
MLVFVTYSIQFIDLFGSLVGRLPVADDKWHPLFIQQGQSFGYVIKTFIHNNYDAEGKYWTILKG